MLGHIQHKLVSLTTQSTSRSHFGTMYNAIVTLQIMPRYAHCNQLTLHSFNLNKLILAT